MGEHIFETTAPAEPVDVSVRMGAEAFTMEGDLALNVVLRKEGVMTILIGDRTPENVTELLNGLVAWLGDRGVAGIMAGALSNYQTAKMVGLIGARPGGVRPPDGRLRVPKKPCKDCPDEEAP
jgi:hypothetical protein